MAMRQSLVSCVSLLCMRTLAPIVLVALPFLLALSSGDQAPSFKAKNQDGKMVQLSDFKGKFVLVYFYPKDDTQGCTIEAKGFQEEYAALQKVNAVVLGVSKQGEKSHRDFRSKYGLSFDLLVDSDGSLAKKFDVGTMPIVGLTKRKSILIGPTGKVIRFYDEVEPAQHSKQVLADIKAALGKPASQ
jgi:peroxiredoxin Q/BCP